MHDANCVFCKIVAGSLPAYKVYEDDHALAFLDIAPFEDGHVLVISKQHANYLTDLPSAVLAPLIRAVQKVAAKLLENLPCDGFNLLQNNGACATQIVPHVHFHVIPRWNNRKPSWASQERAISAEELRSIQKRITNDHV